MTNRKETKEERIERLRQHPAFKDLVKILRNQEPDRVEAFLHKYEDSGREDDHDEHTK